MTRQRQWAGIAALLVAACTQSLVVDGDGDSEVDNSEVDDGEVDVEIEESFFDETRVLPLEIEVSPVGWEYVLASNDDGIDLGNPDFVHADVTVGDTRFTDVALRRKGMTPDELDLKLDFGELAFGRTVRGVGKLNLHNQAVLLEHAAYGVWRDAGAPAPRTGWAVVTVNDEVLGIYLLVEQVDEHFIADRFPGRESGELYKVDDGSPLESAVSKRTSGGDDSGFSNLMAVLESGDTERVAQVLDLAAVVRFLALNRYTRAPLYLDGAYYLYEVQPDRFAPIPWDMDEAWEHAVDALPCPGDVGGVGLDRVLTDPERFADYLAVLSRLVEDPASREDRMARTARTVETLTGWVEPKVLADFLDWAETDPSLITHAALESAAACAL